MKAFISSFIVTILLVGASAFATERSVNTNLYDFSAPILRDVTNFSSYNLPMATIVYDNTTSSFYGAGPTGWQFIGGTPSAVSTEVFATGGDATNPHGTTNTMIRHFASATASTTDITYAATAANGSSFTINTPGIYAISYSDSSTAGATVGFTKNSNQLTTGISNALNDNYRLIAGTVSTAGANQLGVVATTVKLAAGDVIRAHSDSATHPLDQGSTVSFRIVKISN
jgi:hypothetical protein